MTDADFMRLALRLARRGYGQTSPNPMVGAVLVKRGQVIGSGWHRRAGGPHAEIEALRDAEKRGHNARGAKLYVTLEPCCTHGRTPPCTDAIAAAGIKQLVVGASDPNPQHAGRGLRILRRAGIEVIQLGRRTPRREVPDNAPIRESRTLSRSRSPLLVLADECTRLNEGFNHWIVDRTPLVTVKSAMTLDGKIATATGESKWITGEPARAFAMKLRQGSDAILVGVNTILADDPSLTVRAGNSQQLVVRSPRLRRIVLDSLARIPVTAKIVTDECAHLTTVVVGKNAPKRRVAALARRVNVIVAPITKAGSRTSKGKLDLRWLLRRLGSENVVSLLVEGGGEVNASFLLGGLAHRVAFFYAPKILGGRESLRSVGGEGAAKLSKALKLVDPEWRRLGPDLLLTARVST